MTAPPPYSRLVAVGHPVPRVASVAVTLKGVWRILAAGKRVAVGQAQPAFVHIWALPIRPLGRVGGEEPMRLPEGHGAIQEGVEVREVPRKAPEEEGRQRSSLFTRVFPGYPLLSHERLLQLNNCDREIQQVLFFPLRTFYGPVSFLYQENH